MDTTRSPWLLYPGDVGGEIRPPSQVVFIHSIVFCNYLESDHRCRIVDGEGRDVFSHKGSAGLDYIEECYASTSQLRGLRLLELDSGEVRIHIR